MKNKSQVSMKVKPKLSLLEGYKSTKNIDRNIDGSQISETNSMSKSVQSMMTARESSVKYQESIKNTKLKMKLKPKRRK